MWLSWKVGSRLFRQAFPASWTAHSVQETRFCKLMTTCLGMKRQRTAAIGEGTRSEPEAALARADGLAKQLGAAVDATCALPAWQVWHILTVLVRYKLTDGVHAPSLAEARRALGRARAREAGAQESALELQARCGSSQSAYTSSR